MYNVSIIGVATSCRELIKIALRVHRFGHGCGDAGKNCIHAFMIDGTLKVVKLQASFLKLKKFVIVCFYI